MNQSINQSINEISKFGALVGVM